MKNTMRASMVAYYAVRRWCAGNGLNHANPEVRWFIKEVARRVDARLQPKASEADIRLLITDAINEQHAEIKQMTDEQFQAAVATA